MQDGGASPMVGIACRQSNEIFNRVIFFESVTLNDY